MVHRFRLIDAEFRRLAPLYPSTVLIDRDGREFHDRVGLESVIADAGLPPFREIPYEDITSFEPMRIGNSIAVHGEEAGYAWCTTRQTRARAIIAWRSASRPC